MSRHTFKMAAMSGGGSGPPAALWGHRLPASTLSACDVIGSLYALLFYCLTVPDLYYIRTCFYCAMHYSAKRGIAIACRPSVRP